MKQKQFSFIKVIIILFTTFLVLAIGIISYNKFNAYKNYDNKTFYNAITFQEIFEEYNYQLSSNSLPEINKYNINYKVPDNISKELANENDIPVDEYYLYASWKQQSNSDKTISNKAKLSVFFNSIDFYNNSYNITDENYNIALIKAFYSVLIKNNYNCIPESELINYYYSVKNNDDLHGQLNEIPVNSEMSLYIAFYNTKTLISLGLHS